MVNFYILTLFPDIFRAFADYSIIKKGLEKRLFRIIIKDFREHSVNAYGQVDDMPFGGGPGMVLRPEPIFGAFESLNLSDENRKVIYFSPKGRKIDYNYIIDLTNFKNVVLICGHYEGVDQRVIDELVDEQVSAGDFVVTGGEIPAMLLMDALVRHIEGVIRKDSLFEESFTSHLLEYRHYTRPSVYKDLKVPDVLISGNHKKINEFRVEDSIRETLKYRPDLIDLSYNNIFDNKIFSEDIKKIINKIREELIDEYHT